MSAMPDLPQTMKAWIVSHRGDPKDVLKLHPDWPAPPPPRKADLLIRVSYAGLNPVDVVFISSLPTWLPFRRFPIPGMDFCGTVVAAGPAAPAVFAPGAVVCGAISILSSAFGSGTLAEFISVPSSQIALKPEALSDAQAVGLGIAAQTAALIANEAKISPGMRIIVIGASGGVGSLLTQVAKAQGAVVFGICSGANAGMVQSLGVDEVIDYTQYIPLHDHLTEKFKDSPVDVIVDCVGTQTVYDKSPGYLQENGVFITITGGADQGIFHFIRSSYLPGFLGGTPRKHRMLTLRPSGVFARQVAQWVDDGWLKDVPIDSEPAFEDLRQGFEVIKSKRARGKVAVKISH